MTTFHFTTENTDSGEGGGGQKAYTVSHLPVCVSVRRTEIRNTTTSTAYQRKEHATVNKRLKKRDVLNTAVRSMCVVTLGTAVSPLA